MTSATAMRNGPMTAAATPTEGMATTSTIAAADRMTTPAVGCGEITPAKAAASHGLAAAVGLQLCTPTIVDIAKR
jgi:hypothetical protein